MALPGISLNDGHEVRIDDIWISDKDIAIRLSQSHLAQASIDAYQCLSLVRNESVLIKFSF